MTKRPLSTISFNSEKFLRSSLSSLVESGKVQSWLYVKHKAEEDTKKEHIHVLLIPSSVVNPVLVRKLFIEPSFDKRGDLGCLPFNPSKVSDWLLYSLHYEPYLYGKGLTRLNHYSLSDVVTNECFDYVEQIFNEAVESLSNSRVSNFLDMVNEGLSFGELLASGIVPPNQVIFYDKLFKTYRRNANKNSESCITNDVPF